MDGIKSWAAPLGIFIVGQIILLVLFVFMPSIDSAVNSTAVATANVTSTFWGWGWLMTNGTVKFLLYGLGELVVMGLTFIALMKSKT
jgi:hypothetical protein